MALMFEDHAKELLKGHGFDVPRSLVLESAVNLHEVKRLGYPLVLKALVGVKHKATVGAVEFVGCEREAETAIDRLLRSTFLGLTPRGVLAEERVAIAREMYLAVTFDQGVRCPVVLVAKGGSNVDELVRSNPPLRMPLSDVRLSMDQERQLAEWLYGCDLDASGSSRFLSLTNRLIDAYVQTDALEIEINPLAVTTSGTLAALDVKLEVDDDAMFRHPEFLDKVSHDLSRFGRKATDLERAILERSLDGAGNVRFIEYPQGEIGVLFTGGGGSLYIADRLRGSGLSPANYLDFTEPRDELLQVIYKGVLTRPGLKAVVAGAPRTSVVSVDGRVEKLILAMDSSRRDGHRVPPVFARWPGNGEDKARMVASRADGIRFFGSDVTLDEFVAFVATSVH